MAMYDSFSPSEADIHSSFNRAAQEGKRFFLILKETLDDPLQVTDYFYTRAVDDAAEIVPLLRADQKNWPYAEFSLVNVYDLSKPYPDKSGAARQGQVSSLLSGDIQKQLSDYEIERRAIKAERAMAATPWIKRILGQRPKF